jgi:hypothetical protein
MNKEDLIKYGLAAIVGFAVLVYVKKNLQGLIADAAGGVVGVVDDVASGVVIGIGEAVGIPRTNETECEKALREGRRWDASFACPAGKFLAAMSPFD